jgi:hypothetical protein
MAARVVGNGVVGLERQVEVVEEMEEQILGRRM